MLKIGGLQSVLKRIIMTSIVFILLCILHFNIYASTINISGLALNSNSVLLTANSHVNNYYVSQLESTNKPYTSCISAVGKMTCNILCNNDNDDLCKNSVTDISLLLETTDNGAYISDLMLFLDEMSSLKTKTVYIYR